MKAGWGACVRDAGSRPLTLQYVLALVPPARGYQAGAHRPRKAASADKGQAQATATATVSCRQCSGVTTHTTPSSL